MKFHLYSLKVSTNVKIAMQCFENFGGGKCPKYPPTGCAPAAIPSVEWHNLFGNHICAKLVFASCAKTWIKCYRFLHVVVTWGQGRIKWTRGPRRSPDCEAHKTLTTTAQRFTCPRFKFAEAPVKNIKTDTIWQQPKLKTIWGDHLFKQKVVSQKTIFLLPWHYTTIFFLIHSLTIFTAQIVHSHVYSGTICLHSLADQNVHRLETMF